MAVVCAILQFYALLMGNVLLIFCAAAFLLWQTSEGQGANFQKGYEAAEKGHYAIAFREWRLLAEEGDAKAQVYLGGMYANGQLRKLSFVGSIPLDLHEAKKNFRRAAAQNYIEAREYLEEIELFELQRRLALQGNKVAQSNLGAMYIKGFANCSWCQFRVIPKDFIRALNWYRRAASQNDMEAQFNLALAYQNGLGVQHDIPKAVDWYKRAAETGDARALFNLGILFAKADGVNQDFDLAENWFYLSGKQGNTNAWLLYGALKLFGLVLPHRYLSGHVIREISHPPTEEPVANLQ